MQSLILPAFNLLVLISILTYFLRAPLKNHVYTRHALLRDEVKRVRDQLKSSQEKFEEFSSKLKAIDAEILSLKRQVQQDAQSMRTRVVDEAKRLSATVISDARTSAQNLYGDLRTQLYQELGVKVLDRAEALLRERLTGDDRARIRQEFSQQVEERVQ